VIIAVGNKFTVTDWLSVSLHPAVLVTVTVYVPLADTLIAALVAALDQV